MEAHFSTIGLISKSPTDDTQQTLSRVIELLHSLNRKIITNHPLSGTELPKSVSIGDLSAIGEQCDLVIVIGGDGTMLSAARQFVGHGIPIVGINRGRLGFLADISPQNLDVLSDIVQGNYLEDSRMMLDVKIMQGSNCIGESTAANDVVLYKWNTARLIEYNSYLDGRLMHHHRSDGMIVSTPTGSTAYAMSCGGPILHPESDIMQLVPICPHSLSNRPIVVDADHQIEIRVAPPFVENTKVSCDGQVELKIEPGCRIMIQRHEKNLRLIHPANYDYFEITRAKLKWGEGTPKVVTD